MDQPSNILTNWIVENDEWEMEFYWVTSEFIDLMESMMRNFVAFQHERFGDRRFAILSIKVYWDHSPTTIMEAHSGSRAMLAEKSHRNMDVVMRETA